MRKVSKVDNTFNVVPSLDLDGFDPLFEFNMDDLMRWLQYFGTY